MLYLFVLLFLVSVQDMSGTKYMCNRESPCGCSRLRFRTRIFGGENASRHAWGWATSLRDGNRYFCGGSILNERFVLTAAHCFSDFNYRLSNITVCAGTNHLSSSCRQLREAQNIINHPSFNNLTFENDIALIEVKVPFNFSDPLIARICLPDTEHDDDYPDPDTNVTVIGWGRTETSEQSDMLQQATVKIVERTTPECHRVIRNHQLQLCAAAPGKDSCSGDSGGPLMVFTESKRWELIGITSYGETEECATQDPGVYTRITAFLTWIEQATNNKSSRYQCSCECPRGSNSNAAYTTVNTAFACVDACKTDSSNLCNSSNTYACLGTDCAYSTSTGYALTGNIPNSSVSTWPNGDRYEGEFKDGKMHGIGTMNYANGDKFTGGWREGRRVIGRGVFDWSHGNRYEGELKDNIPHGKGTYNFASGNKYIGNWVDGKRTGRGVLIWTNGNQYEGDFLNDVRTGYGVFKWPNGDRYEGQFYRDKVQGTGALYFANGDKYIGNWMADRRAGHGIFTWSDGSRYEGQFNDDMLHGKGNHTSANGNKYIGVWKQGKKSGFGTFISMDGDRYDGDFYNDIWTGRGVFTHSNGDVYDGQFKDGKKHGRGRIKYANGDNYTGEFIEDRENGRGVFMWPSGDRYDGQFKDGRKHGIGTINFANGDSYTGNWIEDQRTGRGVFYWVNGDRYEGEFKRDQRHGTGKIIYVNGSVQYGSWSNNRFVS